MFIKVKLLSGFPEPLLYRVPPSWHNAPTIGTIVKVPMRNVLVSGLVIEIFATKPNVPFIIRDAQEPQKFPSDPTYFPFVTKLAQYYQVDSTQFIKRVQGFFKHKREVVACQQEESRPHQELLLTSEQSAVVDFLLPHIITPCFMPTVLHGVTGSGKTEVYKKLIVQTILHNKSCLLLLPEVTLAAQFEQLLRQQLPAEISIASFHSATSGPQKRVLWKKLLAQEPVLIIGVHLPVLLPIARLGLIIIDEEHEVGYQEKKHPKINTKEAAIIRAQLCNIPILLGSATPSVATLYNVKTRNWKLFQLKKRFAGAFPTIRFVNLLDKKQRRSFWLSEPLMEAIKKQLAKKEQTILFLNRRGVSFFVQCKGCSFVFCCPSCSVSLTLHADSSLRCHYCNHSISQPARCPECRDSEFLKKGIGTQQVVTLLNKFFPSARIGRADLDVTVNRTLWQKTLADFRQQKLDILVGTQTITKGYHFPNVTLVGILWGDINLHLPQYNAEETTLQQLIQVAGRAGRQHPESLVIVQAMNNHPLFEHVNELDYSTFYEQEIAQRTEVGYPPVMRFAEIELKHKNEHQVEKDAHQLALALMNQKGVIVLGPTQPPVAKIKKIFSRKLFLKANNFKAIASAYQAIIPQHYKSSLYFTPNPL